MALQGKQRMANMKQRGFSFGVMGHGRPAYRVTCSRCGVGGEVAPANNSGTLPAEFVEKKLTQKGWKIGKRAEDDICPGCALKSAPPRGLVIKLAGTNSRIPIGVIEMPEPKRLGDLKDFITPKAEPPREMSRDDRRIVFEKLNEVYGDEKTGYGEGWSDEKVAKDLGVPRAWVSKVRDEMFGPERSAATERLLSECHEAVAEAKSMLDQVKEIEARMIKRLDGLAERMRKIAA